jgi:hypothetical protein
MQSGYSQGVLLRRIDKDEPYCPENCVWRPTRGVSDNAFDEEGWIYDWNRAVNRIRKHYGMPPLEGTSYGDL